MNVVAVVTVCLENLHEALAGLKICQIQAIGLHTDYVPKPAVKKAFKD